MSDDRVGRIAAHLHGENARKANFQWLSGPLAPADLQEAYRAQSALHDLWREQDGRKLIGWKIAVTSKAMQDLCGIDQPCVGAMFDAHVLASPAKARLGDFVRLGLEFELAARIVVEGSNALVHGFVERDEGVAPEMFTDEVARLWTSYLRGASGD